MATQGSVGIGYGSHPPHQYYNPSPESANALQRAISVMEEKGLQNDPRFFQLLALRTRTAPDQGFQQFRTVR